MSSHVSKNTQNPTERLDLLRLPISSAASDPIATEGFFERGPEKAFLQKSFSRKVFPLSSADHVHAVFQLGLGRWLAHRLGKHGLTDYPGQFLS